jgi:hypothetical protein
MWSAASVLVCALSILGRPERSFHPIAFVESVPRGGSPNAEAFVLRDPDTIYLITSSQVFRSATESRESCKPRAAIAKLASILVHEEWHLRKGENERGAYHAQLTTLAQLGFDEHSHVYHGVKRAMLSVRELPKTVVARAGE